jgi:cell division cycle protein 37
MSKPFDYSKWDKIELSDDEADCHPNIDKESWFRMKHRSRVEREENEAKDKENILKEMEKAARRIAQLQYDLKKLDHAKAEDSDDDDVDLDDREALQTELAELLQANAARQTKLNEYEKNKKWNVDNMFEVKEERTVVNPNAAKATFTSSGFALDKDPISSQASKIAINDEPTPDTKLPQSESLSSIKPSEPAPKTSANLTPIGPEKPYSRETTKNPDTTVDVGAFETYHEFCERHADRVEEFMALASLEESKTFLLKYGDILLQENASNYLLLASLEDEMNGHREKMKQTARQSQIITNIAELAKTLKTHPGNVIIPFFSRLEQRQHLEDFMSGTAAFVDRLIKRAVVKKAEIDDERRKEEGARDLSDIPKEERLGPGGLDPLEVIETLPVELQEAFESRDVDRLKDVLLKMDPKDAEYHMKRCVDSGLWVSNS